MDSIDSEYGFDSDYRLDSDYGLAGELPMEQDDALESMNLALVMTQALELTTRLDQQAVLQSLVDSAVALTGARFAVLGVADGRGNSLRFVYTGTDEDHAERISRVPEDLGIFSHISDDTYYIANDVTPFVEAATDIDAASITNFLAVPLRTRGRVYGRLYLTDKPGGFDSHDGEHMLLLSQAAAIAVQNSRLYAESNLRAQWISTSRSITAALLEGADEEEALELIAREMRRVARADVALLVLPSIGDTWLCELADGEGAFDYIGIEFPPDSYARTAMREGAGIIIDSLANKRNPAVPELATFGAALIAPMTARGATLGTIVLLRSQDQPSFDLSDLSMAENVAKQAALALELSDARQSEVKAEQMEDRAQISRDLHDFAIQQLFATGMELSAAKDKLLEDPNIPHTIIEALERGISSIDESVGQIRQIIHSLRDPNATIPIMERLRREIEQATTSLGFPPKVLVRNLGQIIDDEDNHTEIDDELGSDIADDIIAVLRECLSNAARHAQASEVSVSLVIENHKVFLAIEDNGKGIDPNVSRRSGLSNLAARARRHHGSFSIMAAPGETGTRIQWTAIIE